MNSGGITLLKEKKMFNNIFRKKSDLEKSVTESIDIVLSVIGIMEKSSNDTDPFITANKIYDYETAMENQTKKIVEIINKKHYLPLCWNELLLVSDYTRNLLNQIVMVFNKIQIYKNEDSYVSFYEHEKKILLNIANFINEYSVNRKYAYQIMVNNQYAMKEFMKTYFSRLNTIYGERSGDPGSRMNILELFEQINSSNEEIQGVLGKIYIGANL